MKKTTKMKTGSKIMTALLAGAAAGVLTFMFVKPKLTTNKKEEIGNILNLKEGKNAKDNLFI